MKFKLYLSIIGAALFFAACEPNEKINEEIDKANQAVEERNDLWKGKAAAVASYTLAKTDYALSSNDDVKKYSNFSATALPKDHLPEILNKKFYAKTSGFEMTVGYAYYEAATYTEGTATINYTLSDVDYKTELALSFPNIKRADLIARLPLFAAERFKYEAAALTRTLRFAEEAALPRYAKWAFDGTKWSQSGEATQGGTYKVTVAGAYELVEADYLTFPTSSDAYKYKNFSSKAKPTDLLPGFLAAKYPTATDGTEVVVKYLYFDYAHTSLIAVSRASVGAAWYHDATRTYTWDFENAKWMEKVKMGGTAYTQYSLFSYKDNVWNFVPPLKLIETDKAKTQSYTLVTADYDMFAETSQYDNFDIRAGKAEETVAARIAKITVILKARKTLTKGDVWEVTYKAFDGSATADKTILLEVVDDAK